MVAVLAISESSKADLLVVARPPRNEPAFTVSPGQSIFGEGAAALPDQARDGAVIGPVQAVSAIGAVDASVFRSELIPSTETKGAWPSRRSVASVTVGATLADGVFLDGASARHFAVVLGIDGRPPARNRPGRRRGSRS